MVLDEIRCIIYLTSAFPVNNTPHDEAGHTTVRKGAWWPTTKYWLDHVPSLRYVLKLKLKGPTQYISKPWVGNVALCSAMYPEWQCRMIAKSSQVYGRKKGFN